MAGNHTVYFYQSICTYIVYLFIVLKKQQEIIRSLCGAQISSPCNFLDRKMFKKRSFKSIFRKRSNLEQRKLKKKKKNGAKKEKKRKHVIFTLIKSSNIISINNIDVFSWCC